MRSWIRVSEHMSKPLPTGVNWLNNGMKRDMALNRATGKESDLCR